MRLDDVRIYAERPECRSLLAVLLRVRSRARIVAALAVVFCCALTATAHAQTATPLPGSNFQGGDGDQAATPLLDDWQNYWSLGRVVVQDDPNANDSVISGKEEQPDGWTLGTEAGGAGPAKNNVLGAWYVTELRPAGNFIYFSWRRAQANGDSFLAFLVHQRTDTWVNAQGARIPCRITGDVLISYSANGFSAVLELGRWTSTANDPVSGCSRTGFYTNIPLNGTNAQGALNAAAMTNYMTGGGSIASGEWGEGVVNLTDTLGYSCDRFRAIQVHSRTSSSISSGLVDTADPVTIDLGGCQPRISVSGPTQIHHGETATFQYTVTNTANNGLSNVAVTDDRCPSANMSGPVKAVGDQDNVLSKGEEWRYTCSYVVDAHAAGEADPITSTATVSSTFGSSTVTDSASHSIEVLHPAIAVDQEVRRGTTGVYGQGPIEAHVGDTAYYRLTVTNPGDTPLTVTPDFAACNGGSTTGPTGDADADNLLDPGEAWVYLCRHVLTTADADPFAGAANVSGRDALGRAVTATDATAIDLLNPAIAVSGGVRRGASGPYSDGPIEARAGDTLNYRYLVTNPGDAPLSVAVSDPRCDAGTLSAPSGDADSDGRLDSGETWAYTCTHVVTPGDGDPLENRFTATGTDALDWTRSADSTETADLLNPAVAVDKQLRLGPTGGYVQGPIEVHRGDTIGYRFTVTNTGDAPVAVAVADPRCDAGTLTGASGDADADNRLDLAETWTYTCRRVVAAGDPDPLPNRVDVTATDALGTTTTASDTASADILTPGIAVDKTIRRGASGTFVQGPIQVLVGDTVHYRFAVTNTSDSPLSVTLSDPRCAAGTLSAPSGDADADDRLDVAETWVYTCRRTIAAGDADPFVNQVTVTGRDSLGGESTAIDAASADVLHAGVDVTSRATATQVHVGDTVGYEFTVANPGDTEVTVALDAPRCDTGTLGTAGGDADGDGRLDPSETWTYTCTRVVTAADADPLVARVDVTATDALGSTATDSDTSSVDVLKPAIRLDQRVRRATDAFSDGPIDAHVGDTLTYRFAIVNDGDTPLSVALAAAMCDAGTLSAPAGDADGDGRLDLTETWVQTCTRVVRSSDTDPYAATATVTGTDALGRSITSSDATTTDVLHPALALDKQVRLGGSGSYGDGPIQAHVGDTLAYRISLRNTGDTPLAVSVSDPRCDAGTLSGPDGDTDGDSRLDLTETWVYSCRHLVTGSDADPFSNRASATGTDSLGAGGTASTDDSAVADILHPGLAVDKQVRRGTTGAYGDGPIDAHLGDTLGYRFTVTNTGDTPLTVSADDPRCDAGTMSAPSGDTDADGRLDETETFVYTCTHVLVTDDADPFVNTATFTGVDAVGGPAGTDTTSDDAGTDVLHPAIELDKDVLQGAALVGDRLDYRFTITNAGDTPLTVALADPLCDAGTLTSPSGDADGDGRLDVDETWVATCSHAVAADDPDPVVNTATVTGTDVLGGRRSATDSASSDVLHAGAGVDVQVRRGDSGAFSQGPVDAHVGDTLEYRIAVTNTGDTPVAVDVDASRCDAGTLSAAPGALLPVGDTWVYACRHVVTSGDADPVANDVDVTVTDSLGGTGTASDVALADVLHPGVALDALVRRGGSGAFVQGPISARVGDTLHYRFVVTNTGDTPLAVDLDSPHCDTGTTSSFAGDADGDGRLDPDETWIATCTRLLAASDADPFVATAQVSATDALGGTADASDTAAADVLAAGLAVDVSAPLSAHVGDEVAYAITVTNTGETELGVAVDGSGCDAGTLSGPTGDADADGRLDRGETWRYRCTHVVDSADGDPFTNDVSVTGTDALGGTDSATDSATVDVLHPGIAVDHEVQQPQAHRADTLDYRFTVTNTGDTPLTVDLDAPRCDEDTLTGPDGDVDGDSRLDVSETWTFECTNLIGSTDGDPITSTVTATGTDGLGGTATATDDAATDVLNGVIAVDAAVVTPLAHRADTLTYRFTVTNTGDTPLTVELDAARCDDGTLTAPSGDDDGDDLLDLTETWVLTCTRVIASGDPDPLVAFVEATGTDVLAAEARDADSVSVDILHPAIALDHDVEQADTHRGDTLTYRFTITNPGDTPLSVDLDTPACDPGTRTAPSGDTNGDDRLDVTETWVQTCTRLVAAGDSDPLAVAATATGTDAIGGTAADADGASTDVLHPQITLDHEVVQSEAHRGDTLTYRFTITNDGDTPLALDLDAPLCDTAPATGAALAAGDTRVLTCTRVVTAGDADPLASTASVTGTDGLGGTASDSDGASTDLLHPAITLDHEVLQTQAHRGDTLTYRFTVTNDGDAPLTLDLDAPRCDTAPATGAALAAGDTRVLTCTSLVTAGDPDPQTATATVTGTDALGRDVEDTDGAETDILHGGLTLEATTAAEAHVGDELTHRFELANDGDTPLRIVLDAPRCDDNTLTGPSGDSDGDQRLDTDETWTYTCTDTVGPADGDPLAAAATATGTDALGGEVSDSATTSVDVLHPQITLDHKVVQSEAHRGDTLDYRFTITNDGDTALTLALDAPLCDAAPAIGGSLGAGETRVLTCARAVTADDADPLVSAPSVTGTDGLGGTATDSDDATTDLLHPAIGLDVTLRRGSGAFGPGPVDVRLTDVITYRFEVTNPGDAPLEVQLDEARCDADTLGDPTGDSDGDGRLDTDETFTYTCTHAVTADDPDPIVTDTTVRGTDTLGREVGATDATRADVRAPAVELTTRQRRGETGTFTDEAIEAHAGDVVHYELTLVNRGDAPVVPELDGGGCDADTLVLAAGDADGDGRLGLDETWTYRCRHEVRGDDADPLVQRTSVTATDALGATATADASVRADVLKPAVEVVEEVRSANGSWTRDTVEVDVGETLHYRFTVTNTGDTPLVVELTPTECDAQTLERDGDEATLAPGQTWTFECRRVVTADDPRELLAPVTVSGRDSLDRMVGDADTARAQINPVADLELRKSGPAAVTAGGDIAFTLVAVNHGPSAAADVVVRDTLPQGLTLKSSQPGQGRCADASGTLVCELGTIASGASASITVIMGTTAEHGGTSVTNRASVAGAARDPRPANNDAAATVEVRSAAQPSPPVDLVLDKSLLNGADRVGDELTYLVTVVNDSPSTAHGVTVHDTLTNAVRPVRVTPGRGTCSGAPAIRCDIGDIAAGESVTIRIVVVALREGALTNRATATAVETDPNPGNNSSAVTRTIRPRMTRHTIAKRADRAAARPGDVVTFTLTYRNRGKAAARRVRICDVLPRELSFVSAPGARYRKGAACWTRARVRAGKTLRFQVRVRVNATPATSTINRAIARAGNARRARASAALRIRPQVQRGGGVTG